MISFVAVLVLFITVTIFVAKRITAPLEQLTMAAENFTVGQKRIDINYKSNDEIGKLAKTLQETTGRLEEYTSYINALAYRDSLTGVKNSTAFKEARHNIEKAIKSEDISFAIVVSDINSLKRINDSYGHEAGNELIRKSVKRICDVFAHSPVYRIGGDEFVAILKGDDYNNRYELLARLENLTSDEFFRFGEYTLPLSVASGMAEYDPKGDDTFDLVFERADKAMYLRKQKIKEETLV
jgi:diguanylate cyclase (GGDEF)-like protein